MREYFIGSGDVKLGPLDASGNPTTWFDVGEVPVFEWNPTTEFADNFSTGKGGANLQDLHEGIKRTATVMITLKERLSKNLEIILHGESSSEVAGTMSTPVNLEAGIAAGDVILLPGDHVGITGLVLKDSAGSPATLAAANYTFDGDSKLITFIDVTGLTQPIKVFSYSYKKSRSVTLSSKTPPDFAVIFDGENLTPGDEDAEGKVWMRIDRVSFSQGEKFGLKSGGAGGTATEVDSNSLTGVALLAAGKTAADGLGKMQMY